MLMYTLHFTTQFKKDLKKYRHSPKVTHRLEDALSILAQWKKLPAQFKNHPLKWEYSWYHEFHLFNDILVLFMYKADQLILLAVRIWSHSDLF